MQYWLVAASGVQVLTGLAHSIIGEVLIFQQLRNRGLVPTATAAPLRERHIRILWATWHLASILGFAFAAILFHLGTMPDPQLPATAYALAAISIANIAAGFLVFVATRGRHPGWAALLVAGLFTAIAVWG